MMNILKRQPLVYPVENKNYISVISPNSGEEAFRYIAEIYKVESDCLSITSSLIGKPAIPPNRDGIGIIELGNILKDHLSWDIDTFNVLWKDFCNNKNFLLYGVEIGEEYVKKWVADDFQFIPPTTPGLSQLCLTTASFSDVTHSYSVGDVIDINSNDPLFVKPGIWRITEVVDNKTVRLNQFWQTSGTPSAGYTTSYADGRTTETLNLTQSITSFAFNGGFEMKENWVYFNEVDWILNEPPFESGSRLITNIPYRDCVVCDSGYQNFSNNFDRLYWYSDGDFFTAQMFHNLYADDLDYSDGLELIGVIETATITYTYSIPTNITALTVGFGPENLKDIVSPLNEDYIFYVKKGCGNCQGDDCETFTDKIYMKYKKLICLESENPYKLLFLDNLGGWSTFNFNLTSTSTLSPSKKTFNGFNYPQWKIEDMETGRGDFCIDTRDFDERVQHIDINEVFNINSEFLEAEQIIYAKDLFKSKAVYHLRLQKDFTYYPEPIIILDNQYEAYSILSKGLRQLQLSFRYANKLKQK
jgi:hypothetical protein